MGVPNSERRRRRASVAKVTVDRRRLSKPHRRLEVVGKKQPPIRQTRKQRRKLGGGTRRGASIDHPITAENNDEESETHDNRGEVPVPRISFQTPKGDERATNRILTRNAFAPFSPISSFYSSSPICYASQARTPTLNNVWTGHELFVAPPSSAADGSRLREPSIYVGPFVAKGAALSQHTRPKTVTVAQHRHKFLASALETQVVTPKTNRQPWNSPAIDNKDLGLATIPKFDQRMNIADLAAVTPEPPICDFYGLLVDHKGRLEPVREHAIRPSQAPQNRILVKNEHSLRAARPCKVINSIQGSDDDEIMVKIDPNESFLEWDNDTPPPLDQSYAQTRQNQSSSTKSRSEHSELARRVLSSGAVEMSTAKDTPKSYTSTAAMKANRPYNLGRQARKNSIKCDFIVLDNIIHHDEDDTLTDDNSNTSDDDSDIEMAGAAPENIENLRIDMQRPYAFNVSFFNRGQQSE